VEKSAVHTVLKIIILLTLLCAVFAFSLPYLLTLPSVRNQITGRLGSAIGGRFEAKTMSWSWLPSPGLVMEEARLSHALFHADVSAASLRLNLPDLMSGKPAITVQLLSPDIRINTLKKKDSFQKKPIALPSVVVVVRNGHIRLTADGVPANLSGHESLLDIFDLDARASITPYGMDIKSACRLTCIEKLNATIRCEKQKATYHDVNGMYWELDINGETINMTEAVGKVLRLFGNNRTVKQVCDIVRGGQAKRAGYTFRGYSGDFDKLENMHITAFPERAIVRVPDVDLHLDNGSGFITIANGVLIGEELSATIGNSIATNGRLRLGLLEQDPEFSLSADLDADMADVLVVLKKIFINDNQRVIDELNRIAHVKGRARSKLIIGDKLNQMAVKVKVLTSDSRVTYQRFQFPIGLTQGIFEFYDDRCTWKEVRGSIGPHDIRDTRGTVYWDDDVRLDCQDMDAGIQSDVIFKELLAWPAIQKKLSPLIRSIKGFVEINDFSISGPVTRIQDLKYSGTLTTRLLEADTPGLPGLARIENASALVTSNKIVLPNAKVDLCDQRFTVGMDLSHTNWTSFTGGIELRGVMNKRLAHWVRKMNWIPPLYFPKTPCSLVPVRIALQKTGIAVNGSLVTRNTDQQKIRTGIDIELKDNKLATSNLTITGPEESAWLWARIEDTPEPALNIGFSGNVTRNTISSILEENRLLSGNITGYFQVMYLFNKPEASRFKGVVEMDGVTIHSGTNPIGIKHAKVVGRDSFVNISNASLALNTETLLVDGRITLSETGIVTDLGIRSDYLSTGNLQQVYQASSEKVMVKETPSETGDESGDGRPSVTSPYKPSVAGTINFDCKQFEHNPHENNGNAFGNHRLMWDDLAGKIIISPDGKTSASITESMMCGLETNGMLIASAEPTVIQMAAVTPSKQDITEFLACIGMENRYLTGQFTLDSTIGGHPDKWETGHVQFTAENGLFRELSILSKIFTLINVTELFSIDRVFRIFTGGYPYTRFKLAGEIADGRLHIREGFVDGDGLAFIIKGAVGLHDRSFDLMIYVKPLKTFDRLVTFIPLVGKEKDGKKQGIAVIPFKVSGTFENPNVSIYQGELH
jgi:hypothetical protein